VEAYDGPQIVGMDLHRRRSVLVRMSEDGRKLATGRITNSPARLTAEIRRAGLHPKVVLEACYGWYWAADTLAAAGAEVHLAHPLGVKAFACRRVKNDELDARDLADLLRMGRLAEAWVVITQIPAATGHRRLLTAADSNRDSNRSDQRQATATCGSAELSHDPRQLGICPACEETPCPFGHRVESSQVSVAGPTRATPL
jgi:transposase